VQLPQQRRKTPQQNPFAHHQDLVTVSDDVSCQVKIRLHESDNYLSQVKLNVKTVNNSYTQDFWRVLRLSAEIYDLPLITIPVPNCRLFSDINISQGSVATRLRCGGIFSYHFTANLSLSLTMKEF